MSYIRNRYKNEASCIKTNEDFWAWFSVKKDFFLSILQSDEQRKIEESFFEPLSVAVDSLYPGINFFVKVHDSDKIDLVFTGDRQIKYYVFIEELVTAAPKFEHWNIIAHKQESSEIDLKLNFDGYEYSGDNIFFIPQLSDKFPDMISIVLYHEHCNIRDIEELKYGTINYLEIFLGEQKLADLIDYIDFTTELPTDAEKIPLKKLKPYLEWRQKEFLEQYTDVQTRQTTIDDDFQIINGSSDEGEKSIAVVNKTLLNWEEKQSHPWILIIEVKYARGDGSKNKEPLMISKLDLVLHKRLSAANGCMHVMRHQTKKGREVYYACKEYKKVSKIIYEIIGEFKTHLTIDYHICKDKYWIIFDQFCTTLV